MINSLVISRKQTHLSLLQDNIGNNVFDPWPFRASIVKQWAITYECNVLDWTNTSFDDVIGWIYTISTVTDEGEMFSGKVHLLQYYTDVQC